MAAQPIDTFRTRLQELLHTHFEGKYTVLAKRAGIPVSSMEHYIHTAKHLPGGEHLVRLANALQVSVDYLVTGSAAVRPADMLSTPVVIAAGSKADARAGGASERQISVPVFACSCPRQCPLTASVPPINVAEGRVVIPSDMVINTSFHRLVGVRINEAIASPRWKVGTRIVVDWDNRKQAWEALSLYHDGTRCHVGRLAKSGISLLASDADNAPPVHLPAAAKILGRVVSVVTAA